MQMNRIGLIISFLILFSLFFSCKNEKKLIDTESVGEVVVVETVYTDILQQIEVNIYSAEDIVFNGHKFNQKQLKSSCATISIIPFDSVTWPKTITVDFGSSNCMGDDGRNRRGKILINSTGRYKDTTTVLTVTFDNYYLSNNKISGTATVANQGVNKAGYREYKIAVQNGIIETPKGLINWQFSGAKQWVNGTITPWPVNGDDVFIHTGNASGTFTDGTYFNADIIKLLITATACPWISSGTIEININQKNIGTLDFGDNTCDSIATVVVDGESYGVGLK